MSSGLHYPCWPVQNGNLLCAVDLETTGTICNDYTVDGEAEAYMQQIGGNNVLRIPGWHEIIQIAIIPIGPNFERFEGIDPFIRLVAPKHPERADPDASRTHGIDVDELARTGRSQEDTVDDLTHWFNNIDLAYERRLIPIAHNWQFEATFLKAWLGCALFDRMWQANACDSMAAANFLRYMAHAQGKPVPFDSVNLEYLCKRFGIINEKPHDAYFDALCGARLFGKLCKMDVML